MGSSPDDSAKGSGLDDSLVYINTDRMGEGAGELGRLLISSFLQTLASSPRKPRRMIFVNSGVFLTTEGSDLLDVLQEMEKAGVEIASCGTCLDFYRRKENLRVGRIGNMANTVDWLLEAGKIVCP